MTSTDRNNAAPKLSLRTLNAAFAAHIDEANRRAHALNARIIALEGAIATLPELMKRMLEEMIPPTLHTVDEPRTKIERTLVEARRVPDSMTEARVDELAPHMVPTLNSVLDWLSKATREELKAVRAWLGNEALSGHRATKPATPKKSDTQNVQPRRDDQQRKTEYLSRRYGIKRVSDGTILKRRVADWADAGRQAAELTSDMRGDYVPVML
jgi:hypothetical protein